MTICLTINLTSKLDKRILPVGVFVDAPIEIVIDLLKGGALGAAQLHGSEPPEYIMKVQEATGKPVIKTFVMPRQNASQKQETQGFQETERICVPQNIQRPEDETNSRWRPQTNDLTNTASAAYRKAAETLPPTGSFSTPARAADRPSTGTSSPDFRGPSFWREASRRKILVMR